MSGLSRRLIYWLLFLPLATLLLLEMTLQTGSYINKHFLSHNTTPGSTTPAWLTTRLRIVTMGDSNTYGLYLDSKDSYPKQLETLWNTTHTNQQIEVINLGYPGANSSRVIANLPEAVSRLQPDLILIMIGTNDSWTMPITEAENQLEKNVTAVTWLQTHSRIYRLYQLLTRPVYDDSKLQAVTTSDPQQIESAKGKPATIDYKGMHLDFSMTIRQQTDIFNADENMLSNLAKLMNFAQQYQLRIIFMTYPANKGYYKQANKLMQQAVEAHHYKDFIDISNGFTNLQPEKGQGNDYFFVDLHATAAGNHMVAQKVMTELEKLLAPTQEQQIP